MSADSMNASSDPRLRTRTFPSTRCRPGKEAEANLSLHGDVHSQGPGCRRLDARLVVIDVDEGRHGQRRDEQHRYERAESKEGDFQCSRDAGHG